MLLLLQIFLTTVSVLSNKAAIWILLHLLNKLGKSGFAYKITVVMAEKAISTCINIILNGKCQFLEVKCYQMTFCLQIGIPREKGIQTCPCLENVMSVSLERTS